MFNPIFEGKSQGWKHPGRCTFAESELLSQKSKHVVQKKKNGHENCNYSHNYCDAIELYQGFGKKNTNWHSTLQQHTPKSQSYRRVMGCSWPMHNVTRYLYPYYGTYINIIINHSLAFCTPVPAEGDMNFSNAVQPMYSFSGIDVGQHFCRKCLVPSINQWLCYQLDDLEQTSVDYYLKNTLIWKSSMPNGGHFVQV